MGRLHFAWVLSQTKIFFIITRIFLNYYKHENSWWYFSRFISGAQRTRQKPHNYIKLPSQKPPCFDHFGTKFSL